MYRRILVPLDGSTYAEHALPAAIAIARRANAAIHLVRAHEPRPSADLPLHPYSYAASAIGLDADGTRARVVSTHEGLTLLASRIRDRARSNGIDVAISVAENPATAILDAVAGTTTDLVAMSRRGCGLSRLVSGSVGEQVVASTALPILMCQTSKVEERAV